MSKVLLLILDGWGDAPKGPGNAVELARKPFFDQLWQKYPHTLLEASGEAVGLPAGTMGNSEVGHLNLGSGRQTNQDLKRINQAITDGSFFQNPVLLEAVKKVKENQAALHLMGLLSDSGVHSHINHLYALLELARRHQLKKVYLHLFLDGRDMPARSAGRLIQALQNKIAELGVGEIVSLLGRFYAMDRDNRWHREHIAYDCIVNEKGAFAPNPAEALKISYARDETDEFMAPWIFHQEDLVKPTDTIIFFNFRSDRARQLTRAFVSGKFKEFQRDELIPLNFICFTEYDKDLNLPVVFPPQVYLNTLGEWVAKQGLAQLRIAETEKYAHITYFFSGGQEKPFANETRILIPSSQVKTYDLQPEMSALEITQQVLAQIDTEKFDLIVQNFANGDMVGHTGNLNATISAIETLDQCLVQIVQHCAAHFYTVLITADHGNAEKMLENDGVTPFTAHTTNLVPCLILKENLQLKDGQTIRAVAPTVLELMGLEKPPEMTEESLIKK